jgi:hypothetical protein
MPKSPVKNSRDSETEEEEEEEEEGRMLSDIHLFLQNKGLVKYWNFNGRQHIH